MLHHRRGAVRALDEELKRAGLATTAQQGLGALPKDGYQGLTTDTDHDWATMVQRWSAVEEAWKKRFPGLTFAQAEAHKQSVRTQSHTEIYRVIETTTR